MKWWVTFNILLSIISVPLCLIMLWRIIKIGKKYENKKKELKKIIHAPGMEAIRNLIASQLKKHDINIDDKQHERN